MSKSNAAQGAAHTGGATSKPSGLPIGTKVRGPVSWFGGGIDPGNANGTTASGKPDSAAGCAIRSGPTYLSNQDTLGGQWLITLKGHSAIITQIDRGPLTRRIDLTPATFAWFKAGFTTKNFPTDSIGTAVYLGHHSGLKDGPITELPKNLQGSSQAKTIKNIVQQALEQGAGGALTAGVNNAANAADAAGGAIASAASSVPDAINGVATALKDFVQFWVAILSPDTQFRVVKGIGGFTLLIVGGLALVYVSTTALSDSGVKPSGAKALKKVGRQTGATAAKNAAKSAVKDTAKRAAVAAVA